MAATDDPNPEDLLEQMDSAQQERLERRMQRQEMRNWMGGEVEARPAVMKFLLDIDEHLRREHHTIFDMMDEKQRSSRREQIRPQHYPTHYQALGAARWEQNRFEGTYRFQGAHSRDGLFTRYTGDSVRFAPSELHGVLRAYDSLVSSLSLSFFFLPS